MKLTAQELEEMKSVNIGAVSADALVPFLSGKRAGCDCCYGPSPLRDKMSRGIDILVDTHGQSYNISVM